jgi:hypothetical protein
LEITFRLGARVHRGGADLAVAHDDRDRVVPLAQRDDVVLGRRLAGEHDLVVAEQRQRLRREVVAGDEEAGFFELTAFPLP